MQNKWTSPTSKRTVLNLVVTNEQYDPTPVLKTIFEQLEKPAPDTRSLDERIIEKSASIARRLLNSVMEKLIPLEVSIRQDKLKQERKRQRAQMSQRHNDQHFGSDVSPTDQR